MGERVLLVRIDDVQQPGERVLVVQVLSVPEASYHPRDVLHYLGGGVPCSVIFADRWLSWENIIEGEPKA